MSFLAAYRKVRQYKAKSWDDVFGNPHPKGAHLGARRQKRKKSRVCIAGYGRSGIMTRRSQ